MFGKVGLERISIRHPNANNSRYEDGMIDAEVRARTHST